MSLCLLAAGAIAIGFAIAWRAPNVTRNFIISEMDLNGEQCRITVQRRFHHTHV